MRRTLHLSVSRDEYVSAMFNYGMVLMELAARWHAEIVHSIYICRVHLPTDGPLVSWSVIIWTRARHVPRYWTGSLYVFHSRASVN